MEGITYTAAELDRFLAVPHHDGYGSGYDADFGDGSGSGDGAGIGRGHGDGFGHGDILGHGGDALYGADFGYCRGDGAGIGRGHGDGFGYCFGSGYREWKAIDGHQIHYIDDVPTVLISVHRSYARGYIVREDLTLDPCYVARQGNSFAHGETLKEAVRDAREKWLEDRPLEERIEEFRALHPDLDTPYGDLFEWHHILTGSCEMGRREWCRDHGYKPTDSITVRTFIEQTRGNYGGDAIRQLAEVYGIRF